MFIIEHFNKQLFFTFFLSDIVQLMKVCQESVWWDSIVKWVRQKLKRWMKVTWICLLQKCNSTGKLQKLYYSKLFFISLKTDRQRRPPPVIELIETPECTSIDTATSTDCDEHLPRRLMMEVKFTITFLSKMLLNWSLI